MLSWWRIKRKDECISLLFALEVRDILGAFSISSPNHFFQIQHNLFFCVCVNNPVLACPIRVYQQAYRVDRVVTENVADVGDHEPFEGCRHDANHRTLHEHNDAVVVSCPI